MFEGLLKQFCRFIKSPFPSSIVAVLKNNQGRTLYALALYLIFYSKLWGVLEFLAPGLPE
jgi:hypothetical protein